ncbi:MAG TPA: hypothetical protein PKN28_04320, partial [Clostridiales bacterium]|nr:hypothetical protein [Clostridiales bacterium]
MQKSNVKAQGASVRRKGNSARSKEVIKEKEESRTFTYGKVNSMINIDMPVKISFLGGLNEVGKNMTLYA